MNWMDPLNDGKSRIELLSFIGGDLDIVNDAKASFEKTAGELTDKEIKLIHYLVKHQHTSPFRGTVFKFKVKAPLFICRQWFKHLIASNHNDEQLGWNEKSLRYVEIVDPDEFYIPQQFRRQSESNKQGSNGVLDYVENNTAIKEYEYACRSSYDTYRLLVDLGVCREQARGVLVPSVYTSWVWTVSLQAVLNFIDLRLLSKGAQDEIGVYAQAIEDLIKPIAPIAMESWRLYQGQSNQ